MPKLPHVGCCFWVILGAFRVEKVENPIGCRLNSVTAIKGEGVFHLVPRRFGVDSGLISSLNRGGGVKGSVFTNLAGRLQPNMAL